MDDDLRIYVDNREDRSGLPEYLKVLNVPITQKQLANGDVLIHYKQYTVAIEIKRTKDLSTSLFSGHLSDQLSRLYDHFDYPILIVQGDEWHRDEDVMGNLRKAIDTLNLRVATFTTEDQHQTVELIGEFIRLLKANRFHRVRRPIILEQSDDERIPILCALPFISKNMAYEILAKYGSIDNALKNMSTWSEINLITPKRVIKIREALRRK